MRWFRFGKKKEDIVETKYWYLEDNKIIRECNGQAYDTDYIYDYYCFFDGMTYLLWIDSIVSRSDDIIEMKIGCIDNEHANNKRVEIKPVHDEYQKIKTIMDIIKAIQKGR